MSTILNDARWAVTALFGAYLAVIAALGLAIWATGRLNVRKDARQKVTEARQKAKR
jgi:HAMP domain-containing protein